MTPHKMMFSTSLILLICTTAMAKTLSTRTTDNVMGYEKNAETCSESQLVSRFHASSINADEIQLKWRTNKEECIQKQELSYRVIEPVLGETTTVELKKTETEYQLKNPTGCAVMQISLRPVSYKGTEEEQRILVPTAHKRPERLEIPGGENEEIRPVGSNLFHFITNSTNNFCDNLWVEANLTLADVLIQRKVVEPDSWEVEFDIPHTGQYEVTFVASNSVGESKPLTSIIGVA